MFHPASLLLAWGAGLIVLQGLNRWALVAAAIAIVVIAVTQARRGFLRMVKRSRYLFLSMLVLFVFMTPGVRLPGVMGVLGLTWEGIEGAAEHSIRLLAMLAAVALLLRQLGRPRLVIGLVTVLRALAVIGVDSRSLAVRLAMTLEEVAGEARRSWRDYLDTTAPGESAVLQLDSVTWHWPDSLLFVASVLVVTAFGLFL